MSNVIINLRQSPYYSGTKQLDGQTYSFVFSWNLTTEKWYMNMAGLSNDVDINGTALLPGRDLLKQHGYYQLGQLWVIDNSGANENPNYDDMGSRWTLEYIPVST